MTPAPPTRSAGRRESIVSCAIGDEQYALRGADACEIVRAERLRRGAGADGSVGTLTVAGETVAVYPLASVLGRPVKEPGPRGDGNHVVVTRGPAGTVGWLVDRIVRSPLPEDAKVLALPDIVGPTAVRFFAGVLRIDDRSLLLLAPESLDPRAPSAADFRRSSSPGGAPPPAAHDDGGSPLVVIFSSPALPRAGVGVARCALSGRRVAAVTRALPCLVVPGGARHVSGLMVWRDAAVPVIDTRAEGERRAGRAEERYLIARCGPALNGALVAFAVTAQVSLHQPTLADRLVANGTEPAPPFVTGVFDVAGERVALLDLDALVASLSAHDAPFRANAAGTADGNEWAS